MTPTLRTLGLPWLAALACALVSAGLLAGALLLPLARPGASLAQAASPAELFGALSTGEAARMREELRTLAPSLAPAARLRLEQILGAEEKRLAEAPPALVLSGFALQLEEALTAIRGGQVVPGTGQDGLLLASIGFGLAAALLALVAGPLALAPSAALLAGRGQWGLARKDLWGDLARAAAGNAASDDDRQGLQRAAVETAKLAQAAEAAQARLDRTLAAADRAAESFARLPALAAAQAEAMEGLGRVAPAVETAERLQAALPALVEAISAAGNTAQASAMEAMSRRLEDAADRLAAEAAATPDMLARLRAAAAELAERQAAPIARLEAATQSILRADGQAEALAAGLASLGHSLARLEPVSQAQAQLQDALLDRLEGVAGALAEAQAALHPNLGALTEAGPELARQIASLDDAVARQANLVAQLDTAVAAEAAQAQTLVAEVEQLVAGQRDAAAPLIEAAGWQREAAERNDTITLRQEEAVLRLGALVDLMPALAEHDEALRLGIRPLHEIRTRIDDAVDRLQSLAEPPPAPAPAPAEPRQASVAARLLDQLEDTAAPEVAAALHRLDGVETEVARLLDSAERMAGDGMGQAGLALPPQVAERAPELLRSLETTIHRLHSVSTALALASDSSLRQRA